MIKNFFKTAFRNFWRNKTFSIINVLGLSIGISAALVIFLIVHYEFSYDKFEPGADRIYRVVLDAKFSGSEGHSAAVPAPLGAALEKEVTGIEHTIPLFQYQDEGTAKVTIPTTRSNDPTIYKKQPGVIYVNEHYFYMLPYKWIAGSPGAALKEPFSVVLTEKRAAQYFPGLPVADIIGKHISYNDNTTTITGIVKDLDETTAFNATDFISHATIAKTHLQDQFMMNVWNDWMSYSNLYIKISNGSTVQQIEAQVKALYKKYNKDAYKDANNYTSFRLQPLNDIHFNSTYGSFGQRTGNKPVLYGLIAIASFLLLLGCINFINLTTAQATQRAKEIGIRKTMGSSRMQLVTQFLSETVFITSVATITSVAITPLLLKVFQDFIPPGVHFEVLQQPAMIAFLLLLIATVSFLSGLYPALILSGFNPVAVLKGSTIMQSGSTRKAGVRKTLTVAQFVIAQFFIIATLLVSKQINYSIHSDMGFTTEAIVSFEQPRDTVASHGKRLLSEIIALPGVATASTGFFSPGGNMVAFTNVSYNNGKEELKPNTQIRWGDPNFIKVYDIKLIAGHNVSPSDEIKEFLVNESYAHAIGFPHAEDALNHFLKFNDKNIPIVGIMKDFHDGSTHSAINPLVMGGNNGSIFHIKLKPNNVSGIAWSATLASIQKSFHQFYPEEDFSYSFFDENIAKMYQTELETAGLLKWATALTVFISCLGLLGLVIYTTNTRTKEIGVRKILGASVSNIVTILSKDFVQLVLIAFVIAAPLGWWAMYTWLQSFVYKTSMSWWIFVISGAGMLLIALITLSVQTIKTATANPVKSLRTE